MEFLYVTDPASFSSKLLSYCPKLFKLIIKLSHHLGPQVSCSFSIQENDMKNHELLNSNYGLSLLG